MKKFLVFFIMAILGLITEASAASPPDTSKPSIVVEDVLMTSISEPVGFCPAPQRISWLRLSATLPACDPPGDPACDPPGSPPFVFTMLPLCDEFLSELPNVLHVDPGRMVQTAHVDDFTGTGEPPRPCWRGTEKE